MCYLKERDNIVSRVVVGDNTNDSEREPHKELTKKECIGLDLTGRQKPRKQNEQKREGLVISVLVVLHKNKRYGELCCGDATVEVSVKEAARRERRS